MHSMSQNLNSGRVFRGIERFGRRLGWLVFTKSIKKFIFLQGGKAKSARFRCRSTRTSRAKCLFFFSEKCRTVVVFLDRLSDRLYTPPSVTADFWKGFIQKWLFCRDGNSIFGFSEKLPLPRLTKVSLFPD